MGISEISWNETFESLLACGIPQLHTDCSVIDIDIFRDEIDANCWLYRWRDTLWVESNSSLMNRLMIELLPTAWSPMKTILNLIVCFLWVARLKSSSNFPLICLNLTIIKLSALYFPIFYLWISTNSPNTSQYRNVSNVSPVPPQPPLLIRPSRPPARRVPFYLPLPQSAKNIKSRSLSGSTSRRRLLPLEQLLNRQIVI